MTIIRQAGDVTQTEKGGGSLALTVPPKPILPVKVFKWEAAEIWADWERREDDRASFHLGSIPDALKFSIRLVTEEINKNPMTRHPITQSALSLELIHLGRQNLDLYEGIGELVEIGSQIHRLAPPYLVATWTKSKVQALSNGDAQYQVELKKQDRVTLNKLAQELELDLRVIVRICLESVLMEAWPEVLREDYREVFKNDCLAFGKWIRERLDVGKMILVRLGSMETNAMTQNVKFDFFRDVIGGKEENTYLL